jgi:L-alanine-DL-glutamate epimerase-like enolase superfamily enzyme
VHDLQVHLLAAIPNASYLEVHGFGLDRFMSQPLVIKAGMARAPERPGHGVELDWEGLASLQNENQ